MKRFSILALYLTITLIISACGARGTQAPPTVNAADIQVTVVAAAFTMIAETQAAIPTATPPPPTAIFTDTPVPTITLLPLPSSAPEGNSGAGDPCIDKALPESLPGDPIRIRLNNSTKAALSVTVYLNQSGPQGECGYRSYTLAPQEYIVINDLVEGCYTLWAWNPDPDSYFIVTNGTSCIDNTGPLVFDISTTRIKPGL